MATLDLSGISNYGTLIAVLNNTFPRNYSSSVVDQATSMLANWDPGSRYMMLYDSISILSSISNISDASVTEIDYYDWHSDTEYIPNRNQMWNAFNDQKVHGKPYIRASKGHVFFFLAEKYRTVVAVDHPLEIEIDPSRITIEKVGSDGSQIKGEAGQLVPTSSPEIFNMGDSVVVAKEFTIGELKYQGGGSLDVNHTNKTTYSTTNGVSNSSTTESTNTFGSSTTFGITTSASVSFPGIGGAGIETSFEKSISQEYSKSVGETKEINFSQEEGGEYSKSYNFKVSVAVDIESGSLESDLGNAPDDVSLEDTSVDNQSLGSANDSDKVLVTILAREAKIATPYQGRMFIRGGQSVGTIKNPSATPVQKTLDFTDAVDIFRRSGGREVTGIDTSGLQLGTLNSRAPGYFYDGTATLESDIGYSFHVRVQKIHSANSSNKSQSKMRESAYYEIDLSDDTSLGSNDSNQEYGSYVDLQDYNQERLLLNGSGSEDYIHLSGNKKVILKGFSDSLIDSEDSVDDKIVFKKSNINNTTHLGEGSDIVVAHQGQQYVELGAGNDSYKVKGGSAVHNLSTGSGSDTVYIDSADSNVNIYDWNFFEDTLNFGGNINKEELTFELYHLQNDPNFYAFGESYVKVYHDGTHIVSLHPDLSQDHMQKLDDHSTYRELGFLNSSLPEVDYSLIEASYRIPGSGLSTLDKFEKLFVENKFLINPYLCSSEWEELSLSKKIDVVSEVAVDMHGDDQVLSPDQKRKLANTLDLGNSNFTSELIYDVLDFIDVGEDYFDQKLLKIQGTKGKDLLYGTFDKDSISGGSHDDIIEGFAGNDKLMGGTGHDLLFAGDGRDVLKGGNGNDKLYGENGPDKIFGGSGNDIMYGGKGDDILSGGAGADKFKKSYGDDTIVDFEPGIDVLHGIPANAIYELKNSGTLITHDNGSLFAEGVDLTDLDIAANL